MCSGKRLSNLHQKIKNLVAVEVFSAFQHFVNLTLNTLYLMLFLFEFSLDIFCCHVTNYRDCCCVPNLLFTIIKSKKQRSESRHTYPSKAICTLCSNNWIWFFGDTFNE